MAAFAMTELSIATNELLVSGFANQVDLSASADEHDITTFAPGVYRTKMTGLGTMKLDVSGFQDYVGPSPATVFAGPSDFGGLDTFHVAVPGSAVGNVAYFGQARNVAVTDLAGAVGDPAGFSLGFAGTSRMVRGVLLHPAAARTATGNGTVTALVPPTATQALHAAFHVHSVTGTGTITFTVQTDDNATPSTPTTRITSSAFTAAGHQFASTATGALAGEVYMRVVYTIVGFTSVTFSVVAGAGTP